MPTQLTQAYARSIVTSTSKVESRPHQLDGQINDHVSIRGGGIRTTRQPDCHCTHHQCRVGQCLPPTKDTSENPNASAAQPTSHSRDVARVPPDPNVISSDSTDSVREQLRQVNQRLDEVRREFAKSKEEVDKSSKAGSSFVISSDSNDSVREQLRQVNQRLDEVRREFAKSKKEVSKSSKAGSLFVPKI
ncbi:hypothetical protein B296_00050844 [Ensete ventricosum]|uniref:Uncharacterized protein n=1 Tax=Ensete ventricosum TaxID=4639 RepID=A0A426Y8R9_ENSVE|nr:hypothetical protein B296_00050844 [Ensete ventricosum]